MSRLSDYQVVVPRKVSEEGHLLSHDVTHHYDDTFRRQRRRRRRQVNDDASDDVHYRLELAGREKHLHLKPNDRLLASAFVVERRRGRNVTEHRLQPAKQKQCHYVGHVKGHPESTVALSACNGLVSWKNSKSFLLNCERTLFTFEMKNKKHFFLYDEQELRIDKCPSYCSI